LAESAVDLRQFGSAGCIRRLEHPCSLPPGSTTHARF
jgi:hypothetical protein